MYMLLYRKSKAKINGQVVQLYHGFGLHMGLTFYPFLTIFVCVYTCLSKSYRLQSPQFSYPVSVFVLFQELLIL